MKTLKRSEAISLLISKPGIRIKHISFSKGEYVYTNSDKEFKDEDGNFLIWDEFWNIRKGGSWEEGWYIWKQQIN